MRWNAGIGVEVRMRHIGFAVMGLLIGAGLALLIALPQSALSLAVDTQGLHLMGVVFVAVPVGAMLGAVLGLLVARLVRR